MPFVAISSADLVALKEELIDIVSVCLVKEPSFESVENARQRAEKLQQEREKAEAAVAAGTHLFGNPGSSPFPPHAVGESEPPHESTLTVRRIRELVHAISRHDGEFVLKLALYVRHELNIRKTASFLTALCAREPKCLPFLECYMERILVLPSDWLSVANYAYFFDNDAAHSQLDPAEDDDGDGDGKEVGAAGGGDHYRASSPLPPFFSSPTSFTASVASRGRQPPQRRAQSATSPAYARSPASAFAPRRGVSAGAAPSKSPTSVSGSHSARSPATRKVPSPPPVDPAAPRLPNALRRALVTCFTKFDEFAIAKYNNDNAEHQKRRRALAMTRRVARSLSVGAKVTTESPSSTPTGLWEGRGRGGAGRGRAQSAPPPPRPTPNPAGDAAAPLLAAPRETFTYKQLIRKLHISEPPYTVCCVLGKRYPATAEEFNAMGLGKDGKHTFDYRKRGRRMRLPVPDNWETRISKGANRGAVWDDLIARNRVPYMAMLRNLRNLLTRRCSTQTHRLVAEKLRSEEQVASSRQFPYRFYSAFTAVNAAVRDYTKAVEDARTPADPSRGRGRGRGGRAGKAANKAENRKNNVHTCELPLIGREELNHNTALYITALNDAVAIATRLNVIPMRGTSIVVLCLWDDLLETVKTIGGGPIGSLRTRLEMAVLLAVMMKCACEHCVIVLSCYDHHELFNPDNFREQSILDNVEALTGHSTTLIGRHGCGRSAQTARQPGGGAQFPFARLDEFVENRDAVESILVIDEGHHTYRSMNTSAPSLGDLPVYLDRLRRTSSENLVYVGVSVASTAGDAENAAKVRARYNHRNDILLTGFSDAILRLVAERTNGGPRASIECADEEYGVNRGAARLSDYTLAETRKALHEIEAIEREKERRVAANAALAPKQGGSAGSAAGLDDVGGATSQGLSSSSRSGRWDVNTDIVSSTDELRQIGNDLRESVRPAGVSVDEALASAWRSDDARTPAAVKSASSDKSDASPSTALADEEELLLRPTPFITLTQVGRDGRQVEQHRRRQTQRAAAAATGAILTHPNFDIPLSSVLSTGSDSATAASPSSPLQMGHDGMGFPRQKPRNRQQPVSAMPPPAPLPRRLLSTYRECRFFISSTFLDMNNERNALTLDVFPRVRRWAAERGLKVNLLEVDLRWGITAVATEENLSTSVCLNEVARCSPFLIGMLGARYGSCPAHLDLVADEDVSLDDFGFLQDIPSEANGKLSVTELEMREGVFAAQRRLALTEPPSVVFFARQHEPLMRSFSKDDVEQRAVYEPDTPTSLQRIERLRRHIESHHVPVIDYTATYAPHTSNSPAAVEAAAAAAAAGAGNDDVLRSTVDPIAPMQSVSAAFQSSLFSTSGTAAAATTALGAGRFGGMSETKRFLTSQDVQLDMKDFAAKAFVALRAIVANVCGVPLQPPPSTAVSGGELASAPTPLAAAAAAAAVTSSSSPNHPASAATAPTQTAVIAKRKPASFFDTCSQNTQNYCEDLCKLYVPPHGLIERLASFALTGTFAPVSAGGNAFASYGGDTSGGCGGVAAAIGGTAPSDAAAERRRTVTGESGKDGEGGAHRRSRRGTATGRGGGGGEDASWRLTAGDHRSAAAAERLGLDVIAAETNLLLLEGGDGNGKSSALAALANHLVHHPSENTYVVYYAVQASDGSLRSLVLYLTLSLILRVGVEDEFRFQESDTVTYLLQLLTQIYAAIKKRKATVIVLLDGLEKSAEPEELLRSMGSIVNPGAAPETRFIVSTSPISTFASALQSRVPPPKVLELPPLDMAERAQLIRRHLASYGKRLQETMELNELKAILRKRDAGHPSYLTSAIMYLRLFSAFDTLREDIRTLPSTLSRLYAEFFKQLEARFDATTCRLVLTTLYLRKAIGGIMEYNLYRLVSNVAVASRLVALLSGTCLTVRRGRVSISSSFFELAIAATYLAHSKDRVHAYENMLAAELLYQPLSTSRDGMESRRALYTVTESIKASALNPSAPCLFLPERYAPRELLGILQSAVQAGRYELAVSLAGYLPFVENLLKDPSLLQRFVSLLSQLRAVNDLVERRVAPIMTFVQRHYRTLSVRPDLIRQCVLNTAPSLQAMSRYSTAFIARTATRRQLERAVETAQQISAEVAMRHLSSGHTTDPLTASGTGDVVGGTGGGLHETAAEKDAAAILNAAAASAASSELSPHHLWVRWINLAQHSEENRLSVFTPSIVILCMAVSTGGANGSSSSLVALGCKDGFARVAPLGAPANNIATLKHAAAVTSVVFLSQNESTLLSSCERGLFYVWSLEDNTLLQVAAAHIRCISTLACHPSEPLVCTGGHDAYTMLWNVVGGVSSLSLSQEEAHRDDSNDQREAWRRANTAPGKSLRKKYALARFGGTRTALQPFYVMRQHRAPVSSVAFHSSGEVLATGSWDRSVWLYNLQQLTGTTTSCRESSDAALVASEGRRYSFNSPVRVVVFVPSLVVTCVIGDFDGNISVIDFVSGNYTAFITHLHVAPITSIAFSPGGKLMVSADEQATIRLSYTGVTGTEVGALNGHQKAVTAVRFHPEKEDVVLSASADQTLQVWAIDAEEHTGLPTAHSMTVTAVAIASDGAYFVTGCADGKAFVFTWPDEQSLLGGKTAGNAGAGSRGRRGSGLPRLGGTGLGSTGNGDSSGDVAAMVPSFSLSNGTYRVTCIHLALYDTRILVGVAFGYVYVWSSSPGFNRREGRLLQRVRTPCEGVFPVVSIASYELEKGELEARLDKGDGCSSTSFSSSAEDEDEDEDEEEEEDEDGADAETDANGSASERGGRLNGVRDGESPGHSSTAGRSSTRDSSSHEADHPSSRLRRQQLRRRRRLRATTALTTVLCSNGDTATFPVFSDTVSLALQPEPLRRESEAVPRALAAKKERDAAEKCKREKEERRVWPGDEDSTSSSTSSDEDSDGDSSKRRQEDDSNSVNTDGDARDETAGVLERYVRRYRLRWLPPRMPRPQLPVQSPNAATGAMGEPPVAPFTTSTPSGLPLTMGFSGGTGHHPMPFIDGPVGAPPPRGMPSPFPPVAIHSAASSASEEYHFGQEILSAVPLAFHYHSDAQLTAAERRRLQPFGSISFAQGSPFLQRNSTAVFVEGGVREGEDRGEWATTARPLREPNYHMEVKEHYSLVVGLRRFFVASYLDHCITPLTVEKDMMLVMREEGFETSFALAEDEVFVKMSAPVRLPPITYEEPAPPPAPHSANDIEESARKMKGISAPSTSTIAKSSGISPSAGTVTPTAAVAPPKVRLCDRQLFAVATSTGNVHLFVLEHSTASMPAAAIPSSVSEQSSHPLEDPSGRVRGVTGRMAPPVPLARPPTSKSAAAFGTVMAEDRTHALLDRVRLVHWHQANLRVKEGADCTLIDSLSLRLSPSTTAATATVTHTVGATGDSAAPGNPPRKRHHDDDELHLVLGCRDGSTRVWTTTTVPGRLVTAADYAAAAAAEMDDTSSRNNEWGDHPLLPSPSLDGPRRGGGRAAAAHGGVKSVSFATPHFSFTRNAVQGSSTPTTATTSHGSGKPVTMVETMTMPRAAPRPFVPHGLPSPVAPPLPLPAINVDGSDDVLFVERALFFGSAALTALAVVPLLSSSAATTAGRAGARSSSRSEARKAWTTFTEPRSHGTGSSGGGADGGGGTEGGETRVLSPSAMLRWVAGDNLGNIYQLRLEDEATENDTADAIATLAKGRNAYRIADFAQVALRRLVASGGKGAGEALHGVGGVGTAADGMTPGQHGWSWDSANPMEWLKRVDVERPLSRELNVLGAYGAVSSAHPVAAPGLGSSVASGSAAGGGGLTSSADVARALRGGGGTSLASLFSPFSMAAAFNGTARSDHALWSLGAGGVTSRPPRAISPGDGVTWPPVDTAGGDAFHFLPSMDTLVQYTSDAWRGVSEQERLSGGSCMTPAGGAQHTTAAAATAGTTLPWTTSTAPSQPLPSFATVAVPSRAFSSTLRGHGSGENGHGGRAGAAATPSVSLNHALTSDALRPAVSSGPNPGNVGVERGSLPRARSPSERSATLPRGASAAAPTNALGTAVSPMADAARTWLEEERAIEAMFLPRSPEEAEVLSPPCEKQSNVALGNSILSNASGLSPMAAENAASVVDTTQRPRYLSASVGVTPSGVGERRALSPGGGAAPNANRGVGGAGLGDDSGSYFAILTESHPPSALGAVEKRQWVRQQHEVLKEALRVQRYNREARQALDAYQRRMLSTLGN